MQTKIRKLSQKLNYTFDLVAKQFLFIKLDKIYSIIKFDYNFPASAGSARRKVLVTLLANSSFPKLLREAFFINRKSELPKILFTSTCDLETVESRKLQEIFDFYGSDKGSEHGYHLVYSPILKELADEISIMEIGIGTKNRHYLSNMGKNGTPGASLRAWRSYRPSANIVGLDIDKNVLFQEKGIKTFHLDQTSISSWDKLKENLGIEKFDLIIDDGLHSLAANLSSLVNCFSLLKPYGIFVIEDVSESTLPVWEIMSTSLNVQIFRARKTHLVVIRND